MVPLERFERSTLWTSARFSLNLRYGYILLLHFIIRTTMSNIYIEKNRCNKVIRLGRDLKFVNGSVQEKLEREGKW